MKAKFAKVVGGILDGETVEVRGMHLVHPFMDAEYTEAYSEWFKVWGISYSINGHYRDWEGVRPPAIPQEQYRWERDGDEFIARFDKVIR